MKVWEFKDHEGYRRLVHENENGDIIMSFLCYSLNVGDWEFIDYLKKEGKLFFVKEYEVQE